jgi:hypothetical protein
MNYVLMILFLTLNYTKYIESFKLGHQYTYNYESVTNVHPSSKTNINISNPYFNIKAKFKFQVFDSKSNENEIFFVKFQVINFKMK